MVSEQVLSILATDNLDIACAAIEKAAMERAVSDVDEGFAASYEARRRHREVSCGQSCYFALSAYANVASAAQRPNLLGSIRTTV
jgi:CCR4-NOT transcription complex subunit 1